MSKNNLRHIYFVELCTYIIQNVSNNVQINDSREQVVFIWSPVAMTSGKSSDDMLESEVCKLET